MAKLLKLRGGTTSQHSSFTGADREVTVDTDKETLVVHDGSTAGGHSLMRSDIMQENLNVNGNSIVSASNGNIAITPNGSGEVDISKVDIDSGAIDGTTIGANSAAAGTFTTVTANGGVNVDNITIDGTEIDLSSGNLLIDVAGDIDLDSDSGIVKLLDGGTEFARFFRNVTESDLVIRSIQQDEDIFFQGNDGGTFFNALTLDMSEAGAATFNNNVTAFSDERLKDNIETLDGGLSKILSMRGVTYTRDGKDNVGVIAQEVENVIPQIVKTADDEMGTKSVDYSRITAVLIEAVKELTKRVEELENK